jgi:hypothetical protein
MIQCAADWRSLVHSVEHFMQTTEVQDLTVWTGRGGPITWPSLSPDLTPDDFCLWGYAKDAVFVPHLQQPYISYTDAIAQVFLQIRYADVG